MVHRLRDWRWPDKRELTEEQQKPWSANAKKVGNELVVVVVDPDGQDSNYRLPNHRR
jgi:hypothetical protein